MTEGRIYRLAVACVVLAGASFVLPRFVPNTEGGFASGATAVLVFLAVLAVAWLLSIYLLLVTVKDYRSLSLGAKVAGLGPCLLLGAALVGLFGFLSY